MDCEVRSPFSFGFGAHVAQSAEHILGKDEVTGSIPVMGSVVESNARCDQRAVKPATSVSISQCCDL